MTLAIAAVILAPIWQGPGSLGNEIFSEKNLGEINSIKEEENLEEARIIDFISPDNKLNLKYFTSWKVIDDEELVNKLLVEKMRERYSLEDLLVAFRIKGEKPSQLFVIKGLFKDQERPEDIIEIMKKSYKDQGINMTIIEEAGSILDLLDKNENKATSTELAFEATYEKEGEKLRSKEKILWLETKEAYLVTFMTPSIYWEELEEIADFIIDSAKLID